eukprot:TRINITY_DN61741_c0_g1_i1.p1 TRINITY_DN61741_c0_g1~~TRINITY_DN61741_c0_g1_i1.p1  ORF type:complete len:102 (+),score=30.59 TRINITY_DN61741_c0_g1_i1:17-322(+)
MTTYNDLLKQIESLTKQAEELRKTEISTVIADIKDKMETFGITLADLGAARSTKKSAGTAGSKVAVKYRNGSDTWSGRGRTPKWLADAEAGGANRESFLVK